MKIKQVNAGFVTNFEVFTQLNSRHGTDDMGPESKLFKENVLLYLTTTPAAQETSDGVKECLKHLDSIRINGRLTKAEKLQIINLVPMTEVEMHLIIEECPERLAPEETQDLTQHVARILFPNAVQDESMQDVGEGGENNNIENGDNENGDNENGDKIGDKIGEELEQGGEEVDNA